MDRGQAKEEEDESEGRSEFILQQDMDNDTMDTAIIIDTKLFLACRVVFK